MDLKAHHKGISLKAQGENRRFIVFVIVVVVGFSLGNVLLWLLLSVLGPAQTTLSLLLAAMGAQAATAAVFSLGAMLIPGSRATRTLWGSVATTVLFASWATGVVIFARQHSFVFSVYMELILQIGLCLPLFLLAIQSPLGIAKIWFRWRVVHVDGRSPFKGRGISTRDLIVFTGAVALALVSARLAVPGEIVLITFAAALAAITSLLTTLPAICATLRPRWHRRAAIMSLAVLLFDVLASAIVHFVFIRFLDPTYMLSRVDVMLLSAPGAGYGLVFSGTLIAIRCLGYRLLWGKQTQAS